MRIIGNPHSSLQRIAVLPGTVPIQAALTHLPLVGRSLSEDPGMKVCAQWLQAIVPEAPVRWLAAGDPYWRPAA